MAVVLAVVLAVAFNLATATPTVSTRQEKEGIERDRRNRRGFSVDVNPSRVIQPAVFPFEGGQSYVLYSVRWFFQPASSARQIQTDILPGPIRGLGFQSIGGFLFYGILVNPSGPNGGIRPIFDLNSYNQEISNGGTFGIESIVRVDGLPDTGGNPPPIVQEIRTAPTYNIVNNNITAVNNTTVVSPARTEPDRFSPKPAAIPPAVPSPPSPIAPPKAPDRGKDEGKANTPFSIGIPIPFGVPVSSEGTGIQRNIRVNDPIRQFAVNATSSGQVTFTPIQNRTNTTTATTTGAGTTSPPRSPTSAPTGRGTTTTTPPDKNRGVETSIPPLFNPIPTINNPNTTDKPLERRSPPPPVEQTPPGNNCCYATPLQSDIGAINRKVDAINPALQALDLSLLGVINAKLGPQVPGGLGPFLQDRFTKLWKSRVIDRALTLMATVAAIHNAVMLSRNIGGTLIQALGNGLTIIGIKDADDKAVSFGDAIGDGIENIVKGIVGQDNYTQLSETWAKANRIYQSAINAYQLLTDSMSGLAEGLEQTAKYTGKIGNALKASSTIIENSIDWMNENFEGAFRGGKLGAIDKVIRGLRRAEDVSSDLESITGNFREVRENIEQIGGEINTIRTEIKGKEDEKKTTEDEGTANSQSPQITKANLIKPEAS